MRACRVYEPVVRVSFLRVRAQSTATASTLDSAELDKFRTLSR